jgi:NAD(P)-dependent dehydrogenase (short-subunit alcohol dehydrogenase family)
MVVALQDRTALVTGGTTGIGHAVAKDLIEAGARVLITGQDAGRVASAAAALGPRAAGFAADSRSVAACDLLAEHARALFGHLDILVANAGVTWMGRIEEVSESSFDGQMAINFKGAFFTVQKCLPLLRTGASIVMTASCLDEKGIPGVGVYSASKAAVRSLVRTLAAELADRGIRVNSVAPGPIDTPIYDKLSADPGQAERYRREEAGATLMKRMGNPAEVARVVTFLASDAASFMTGANVRVDGGWTDI